MFKNRFFLFAFFLLLGFTLLVIFQSQIHNLFGSKMLNRQYTQQLAQLGAKALKTGDVPVGAMLVYDEKIIGMGYNTVKSSHNLAGHAEINALNEAVNNMGIENFNQLKRNKLVLYTTYEPCEMCKGTLIHYNIRQVRYIKGKSLGHWLKSGVKNIRYEFNKRQSGNEQLQDSLFMLHPHFPGKK